VDTKCRGALFFFFLCMYGVKKKSGSDITLFDGVVSDDWKPGVGGRGCV
jgi:hypothetical protein